MPPIHNLPLIMAFNVQKLPFCPPSPLTNPGYTTITGVAKGDTRAHSHIPPLIGEFKKGGGRRELVYATTKPTNNGQKNAVLIHTFSKISLPWKGDSPLPPLGNFAPSLCPPPPLTNHGYTIATGVAIREYKGPAPPPPPH